MASGGGARAAVHRLRVCFARNNREYFNFVDAVGRHRRIVRARQSTSCVTPCVVVVKRSADITVTVNKEGYEPQVIPLTKEVPPTGAAGFAGNVLLGGVVGMGVDAVTGAAQDHKPNPVIVTLNPASPPPAPRVAKPRSPKRAPPPPQS